VLKQLTQEFAPAKGCDESKKCATCCSDNNCYR